jgi:hypothetical protein
MFAQDIEQTYGTTVEITENVKLPGTKYNAKKGTCVEMFDGKPMTIIEFYIYETNSGIYGFIFEADASHMD